MIVKNQKMMLLKAVKHEGVKPIDKKPYMFYSCTWLDEDTNIIRMNVSNELAKDAKTIKILDVAKNTPVIVDFAIYQSGFNLRGTVVKVDVQ